MSEKEKWSNTWDEYFMGSGKAFSHALQKIEHAGEACIVSGDNKILSMGYVQLRRNAPTTISVGKELETEDPYMPNRTYDTQ